MKILEITVIVKVKILSVPSKLEIQYQFKIVKITLLRLMRHIMIIVLIRPL